MKVENFHASVQIGWKEHPPSPSQPDLQRGSPLLLISQLPNGKGAFSAFCFCFVLVAPNDPKPTDWETQISAPRSPVSSLLTRNCHLSVCFGTLPRVRALPKHGPCFFGLSVAAPLEFNLSGLLEQQITQHENCGVHSDGKRSLFFEVI